VTTTNDNAPPYVAGQPCDRCRGAHGEGDAETGERLPCTRCFGLSPRPAGLDLDAIDARERAALAAVRERLRCERLDADAAVALMREERRADDAVALVARVREFAAAVAAARREGAEAMREACAGAMVSAASAAPCEVPLWVYRDAERDLRALPLPGGEP